MLSALTAVTVPSMASAPPPPNAKRGPPPFAPPAFGSKLPPFLKNAPLPSNPRAACAGAGAVARPTAKATPPMARTAASASAISSTRLPRRFGGWFAATTGVGTTGWGGAVYTEASSGRCGVAATGVPVAVRVVS